MTFPLVRDLAADGIPVVVTCRVLKLCRQQFYRWLKSPVTQQEWDDAHLVDAAVSVHENDPMFGYRFIADELIAAGYTVSERRVWRLCSQQKLWSAFAKKRGLHRKPGPPVHDDLVKRDFSAGEPNRVWLTDITEHPTGEGKLYLAVLKDVFSNRIVGYSMGSRMTSDLAVAALQCAVNARGKVSRGVIVHSDRGSQFRSKDFVKTLSCNGLTGSMGRVGACGDNAAMESFFALLQKNVLNSQRWETRHDLRLAIIYWIEGTYHRRRKQRALGKTTPVEYERINQAATAA